MGMKVPGNKRGPT